MAFNPAKSILSASRSFEAHPWNCFFCIDLGTSNSAIACFDGSDLSVIPNSRGETNTPSVLRFTEHSVVVGAKAQNFLFKDPLHTIKNLSV